MAAPTISVLAFSVWVASPVQAQSTANFPYELESDRKPKTQTNGDCLLKGGTILTAKNGTLYDTDVLVRKGKIVQIGKNLKADGAKEIDVRGLVIAPGIVDAHSHRASDGTNEGSESITAEVRIGDVLNLSAINAWQALASGHTTALILHGSANAVGGESQVIKYKYGRPSSEAPILDAPRMIKFALGENVTRKSSTNSERFPRTRMGQEAVYRRAFTDAREYMKKWDDFNSGKSKIRPRKDLRLETLSDVLRKKIWVQCHSYRSDEMLMMVRLSQEFGFKIGALQHALEAYKIAPELAAAGVGVSIFIDSWSFKQEGYDSIPFNAWICRNAGVNVSINTDGVTGTTALNIDAAKTMRFGGLSEQEALQTITLNPAKQLGIDHRVGSIEVGKDADFGIWKGHPLSVYSKCVMTMVEGEVFFERRDAHGLDSASTIKTKLDRIAKSGEAKPLPSSKKYAIVGANIHTVSGAKISNGTVLVENGRITAVGNNVSIPSGTVQVSARGMNLIPGFIDGNSTIGLQEISPIPVMVDSSEFGTTQPDLDASRSLWVESAHYGPARYNGVTNCFAAPTGRLIGGQGAMIHTDGLTTEALTLKPKAGLVVNIGGFSGFNDGEVDICCDAFDVTDMFGGGVTGALLGHQHSSDRSIGQNTQDRTLADLERYYDFMGGAIQRGPRQTSASADPALERYFEKAAAYLIDRKVNPDKTPIDVQLEAMLPYLRREKVVVVNARTAGQIRSAVAFIEKFRLKGVLNGAQEAWRETELLKKSGIPVIIQPAGKSNLSANSPENSWDPYDTPYALAALLAKGGVKFCFSSQSGSDVMNLPVRVAQSCAYGLSTADAIRALTLSAAEIFGVENDLGSIEVGKLGNFILVEGDPFEMTSQIRHVFINGKPASMQTKHTQLRDRYQSRYLN